jgi:hypothetical protein
MLNVPLAQSIRFRPVNTALPNFDNTFAADTDGAPYSFDALVPEQSVSIQCVTPDDNETYAYLHLIHNGTGINITDVSTSFLGQYKYETFTIDFSLYPGECCTIEVFEGVLADPQVMKFESEPFKVETNTKYLQCEWWNAENSFQMDYSAGLTHILQIEAKKWKMSFGGDSTVYVNQGEETKLKGIVKRIFLLECELPDYLCEILTLAMEHDHFYINSVEFVTSKKPTITQLGTSGMYSFSAEVSQRNVIGLNTHDVG